MKWDIYDKVALTGIILGTVVEIYAGLGIIHEYKDCQQKDNLKTETIISNPKNNSLENWILESKEKKYFFKIRNEDTNLNN